MTVLYGKNEYFLEVGTLNVIQDCQVGVRPNRALMQGVEYDTHLSEGS